MEPTWFICTQTLKKMGIYFDVKGMLARIGLGTLGSRPCPLYPELVRQFLASVEVMYAVESAPRMNEGIMTFFCNGIKYTMDLKELCEVYRFDRDYQRCVLPTHADFREANNLWNFIAKPVDGSRDQKLSLIRNPAVRIVAKILGTILFSKEESGSLRIDELFLIHCALPPFVQELYNEPFTQNLNINIGAIFAQSLAQKKFRGLSIKKPKTEYCGSLLTPIFKYCGVDLTSTPCVDEVSFLDEEAMKKSGYFKAGVYNYVDRDGRALSCSLPIHLSGLASLEHLAFLPSEADQRVQKTISTRRRAAADDAGPSRRSFCHTRQPSPDRSPSPPVEYLLPPYTGEYRFHPRDPTSTLEQKMDTLHANQEVIHSMLTKIWMALQHIPRPRVPSCLRPSRRQTARDDAEEDEDAEHHQDPENDATHSPVHDTAGTTPTTAGDEDEGTEDDTPQLTRKRLRRSSSSRPGN